MLTEPQPPEALLAGAVSQRVAVDGVSLHTVAMGRGAPVVLLHGFPEFWYSWRHQLPALAAAGFGAVAPDLRGYHLSDRPPGIRCYRTRQLVHDVATLIETLGRSAFVVGHDWGGVVAWRLAALHPQLVRKLVILNAPHPAAFRRESMRNPAQWLRSSYAMFFQLPWLPEFLLRRRNFGVIERALRRQPVHGGAFSEADIRAYKQAFDRPDGLRGPLNYYRAAVRYPQDLYGRPQTILRPTLVLWGDRDPFLSVRLTEGLNRWVPDLQVVRFSDASHWIQNDIPERVNGRLMEFFSG